MDRRRPSDRAAFPPQPPGFGAVRGTFTMHVSALGFEPPPVRVQVQVHPSQGGILLLARVPEGPHRLPALMAWLERMGPATVNTASNPRAAVARAWFPIPPAPLAAGRHRYRWMYLTLEPDGSAVVEVRGETRDLGPPGETPPPATVPELPVPGSPDPLTRRQQQALMRALECGYYKVPRSIELRELAARMGTSPAALSELLRRGEGRLVQAYVAATRPPPSLASPAPPPPAPSAVPEEPARKTNP